jgi:hypothetical protein
MTADLHSLQAIETRRAAHGYHTFLQQVQAQFVQSAQHQHWFTTDISNVWDLYLQHLPEAARQQYNCATCRKFIQTYGGLVCILPDGRTESALWNDAPEFFQPVINALKREVERASVTGVFIPEQAVYGKPETGQWQHLAIQIPADKIWQSLVKTAFQASAEKREDFKILQNGLTSFPLTAVKQALKLLRSDNLYRSEHVLGVAEWLHNLHAQLASVKQEPQRLNLIWRAVASAPAGFCHVRSTMIGTLLEDIVAGYAFSAIEQRFAAKMHPLQYQRPQAAPSAGNIAQAEKILAQLSASGSLDRRFARLDELNLLWQASQPALATQNKASGVFAHLVPKAKPTQTKPADITATKQTLTWEKFQRTVLPHAQKIELLVTANKASYGALTTALNADAPPILQWDSEQRRNPFAHYVYSSGSLPTVWNLTEGYTRVTGICLGAEQWQEGFAHHGKKVHFLLAGAKDSNYAKAAAKGNALFPETLKSEFHPIRATIEAYSKKAKLHGYVQSNACGLTCFASDKAWQVDLRVTNDLGTDYYRLDRWD